jgi:preprotein translocase SecE subunit
MNKIRTFVRETRAEFSQITWPPRNEAIRLTFMVVLFSAVFAVFLGAIDYFFGEAIKSVIFAR